MHTPDRYALALAMLEGDREARKVLADMLEEQGERGLAQWAREGRNKAERRLDLAIMLLPCSEAIVLGAEFCDSCLASNHLVLDTSERASPIVESWITGTKTKDEAVFALQQLVRRMETKGYFSSDIPIQQLVRALDCRASAELCLTTRAGSKAAHWELEAKQAIRAVSYYTRRRTVIPNQIDRTKDLFKKLLAK
jgi:hypothetical protein